MKAQLREHVRVNGDTTRSVEVARIDWVKRAVFLDDGRWIPFEMVAIGDPQPVRKVGRGLAQMRVEAGGAAYDSLADAHEASMASLKGAYDPARVAELMPSGWVKCKGCGAPFASPQKLGGHRRHCKGQ